MARDAGMAKRCYYEVLEVERTVNDGELKTAFRKLAMKWHPDRNPGDKSSETRFKEINEAYEVLKDADKRAAYDRFGHAAFEHGGAGAPGGFGDVASAFADIFDDLFGMGGGARRGRGGGRERGADLRYNMEISLEEAYAGKAAQVRIPTSVTCEVLLRLGRQDRHPTQGLPDLRRARTHPSRPGFLHARAYLPELPGPRPGDRQSLPVLRRLGTGHARARAVRQHSAGRRGRHPHPARRRR